MNDQKTSIQISTGTRDRLVKLGWKSETYDDILNRLLDQLTRSGKIKKGTK